MSSVDTTVQLDPVVPGYHMHISGSVHGSDIRWNNFKGELEIIDTQNNCKVVWTAIDPFTNNCGAKAMAHISAAGMGLFNPTPNASAHFPKCLELIESFLYHVTNASYVVGSDWHGGNTRKFLDHYGHHYVWSPFVWNPNYTWDITHTISIFYKRLPSGVHPALWLNLIPQS